MREITPRTAHVRIEDRVSREYIGAYHVPTVIGRVAGQMEDLGGYTSDLEGLVILEEVVECGVDVVGRDVVSLCECGLDLADAVAGADGDFFGTCL